MSIILAIKKLLGGGNNTPEKLKKRGAIIGDNFRNYGSVDAGHPHLFSVGNNVIIASGARILTHDASTKIALGYSKIGCVTIGNEVFVGADSLILPNVKIGNKVIIGAGSVVCKDIPDNSVAVGNPAKVIGTYDDYIEKNKKIMENAYIGKKNGKDMTFDDRKAQLKELVEKNGHGFDL